MSETTNEAHEAPKPQPPAQAAQQPEPPKVEETDWKAEARKWEQRAKENKAAAETAAGERDNVKAGMPKQVAEALRPHLVAIHGLSDDDAALYLTSDDPATLLKQAAGLAARSAATASSPMTPKPDLTQGGKGEPPALNSSALEEALKAKLGIA